MSENVIILDYLLNNTHSVIWYNNDFFVLFNNLIVGGKVKQFIIQILID